MCLFDCRSIAFGLLTVSSGQLPPMKSKVHIRGFQTIREVQSEVKILCEVHAKQWGVSLHVLTSVYNYDVKYCVNR